MTIEEMEGVLNLIGEHHEYVTECKTYDLLRNIVEDYCDGKDNINETHYSLVRLVENIMCDILNTEMITFDNLKKVFYTNAWRFYPGIPSILAEELDTLLEFWELFKSIQYEENLAYQFYSFVKWSVRHRIDIIDYLESAKVIRPYNLACMKNYIKDLIITDDHIDETEENRIEYRNRLVEFVHELEENPWEHEKFPDEEDDYDEEPASTDQPMD